MGIFDMFHRKSKKAKEGISGLDMFFIVELEDDLVAAKLHAHGSYLNDPNMVDKAIEALYKFHYDAGYPVKNIKMVSYDQYLKVASSMPSQEADNYRLKLD